MIPYRSSSKMGFHTNHRLFEIGLPQCHPGQMKGGYLFRYIPPALFGWNVPLNLAGDDKCGHFTFFSSFSGDVHDF